MEECYGFTKKMGITFTGLEALKTDQTIPTPNHLY